MSDTSASILAFDGVKFAYDRSLPEVIHGVSFDLAPGSFTVIVGASGSGKSTILRLAIGLDTPTKGTIALHERTRMIFQSGALLPWASVLDNVLIGFTGLSLAPAEQKKRALARLEELGIAHLANAYPRALSGGQRQRVGIARALVSEPKLLLLDEPFSALDTDTSERLAEELLSIRAKQDMTMFMVSHSIEDAVILADSVFVFKDGVITHTVPISLPHPRRRDDPLVVKLVRQIKALLPGE
ncbi:MAG: transporter ATP-binding protein [Parcubacteria group bacterium]|nr:transporter ATP-binding protein [Parcubacteria group bacterium]